MKKSYFAVPVSVALVASAMPPVHAATIELSDIKGHPYESEIRALVNDGIITGYSDKTFKPGVALQRSDVVFLLGRYLESKGYRAPADYKTNMRFKDLSPTMNDAYLKYAALVNEAGVFLGANGYLLSNELLSRHHAALVLVRTISKLNGVEYASDANDVHYMDIQHLPQADQQIIGLFHDYQLVKENYFKPEAVATRGDFAHFLYGMRALSDSGNFTIKQTQILNSQHVLVTFTDNRTYDVFLPIPLEIGVPKTISFNAFGRTFTHRVTMTTLDKLGVANVINANGAQFTIRFTKPVHLKSEYTATEINQLISLSPRDYQGTPSLVGAKLSEDKMSLTVTTNGYPALSKRYYVKINEIASLDGERLSDYNESFTFTEDKTAPRITGTQQLSESKILLQFSEPLRYMPSYKTPVLANGKYVYNVRMEQTADQTGIIVDLSSATVDGKTLEINTNVPLEFYTITDYANNSISNLKTTVKKSESQNVIGAPKVVQVEQVGARQIAVTFSKEMNLYSLYYASVIDGRTYNDVENIEQSTDNPNKYIFTVKDILRGYGSIGTSSTQYVQDLAGNKLSFVENIAYTYDASKAQVISTEVMRDENSEYLYIYFDKNVDLTSNAKAILSGSYVVNGQRFTISSPIQADLFQAGENKKIVRVLLSELLRGIDRENVQFSTNLTFTGVSNEYRLKVTETVPVQFQRSKDFSFNANKLKVTKVETSHTNPDIRNSSIIRVTFSHTVDVNTATDINNYDLNRFRIEKVELNRTTLKSVDLYVTPSTINQLTPDNLYIEKVRAANSVYEMESYYEGLYLNENIRPYLSTYHNYDYSTGEITIYDSNVMTASNELTLTFSEALADVPSDLFLIRNSSGEVIESVATLHPTDKRKVVIRLDRNLARSQKVTIQFRSNRSLTDLYFNEFDRKTMIFTTPYYY